MKSKKFIFYSLLLMSGFLYGSTIWSANRFDRNPPTPSMYRRPKPSGYFNRQSLNNAWAKARNTFKKGTYKAARHIYKNKKTAAALGVGVLALSAYYSWKKSLEREVEEAREAVESRIINKIYFLEHKANELRAIYKSMEADPELSKRINPRALGFEKMKKDADEVAEDVLKDINSVKKTSNLKVVNNIKLNADWLATQELTIKDYIKKIEDYYNFINIYCYQ